MEADADLAVAHNIATVREHIARAREGAPHAAPAVELVAVSKQQPAERIRAALVAGQRVFGENRVQEAAGRWPALREEFPGIVLHLIGPLQTNKVRQALALFDVIETVDRPGLAAALATEMAKSGLRRPCFVQVNTGAEPQKAGVAPEEAPAFIERCRGEWRLPVEGLMCIPPADEDPAPHFAFLAELARRHRLPKLSMGMSADYELAVRFGATHVRVGSALFGPRLPRQTAG